MADAGEAPVGRNHPHDPATILLIGRAQLGDRLALDRLLRMIQSALFDHILFITQNPDTAKDVLQDVLILVPASGSVREPRLFRAWVFRIATRGHPDGAPRPAAARRARGRGPSRSSGPRTPSARSIRSCLGRCRASRRPSPRVAHRAPDDVRDELSLREIAKRSELRSAR